MKNLNKLVLGLMSVFVLLGVNHAVAGNVSLTDGLAVKGHDVVAYFSLAPGAPAVKGDASITSQYNGATYQFATAGNKAKFDADPAHYAPQYGGYCAFGVTKNRKLDTDPNAWAIEGGKLYLNLDSTVANIWNKDRAGYIEEADEIWPTLLD